MRVLVTVNIDAPREHVEQCEREHPEVIAGVAEAAVKYMTGHTRTYRDGFVMDVDTFASEDDYHAFIAEAGLAIAAYAELIGVVPRDTVWLIDDDARSPEDDLA